MGLIEKCGTNRESVTLQEPAFEDLRVCRADYSPRCPEEWTPQPGSAYRCVAPDTYDGPCNRVSALGQYDSSEKALWAQQCGTQWPQVCEDVSSPTIESVRFSTQVGSRGVATIHASGYNFGDDADQLAVKVGNMECTGVQVCHTVCRPCASDAECGGNGLCLTVNNVEGSFCSVFCDTSTYSCPCDTQCHAATANGMVYHFCLNPGISSYTDLCSQSYRTEQRHAENVDNFRCEITPPTCIPPSLVAVSVAIRSHSTPWHWYSVIGSLSAALSVNNVNPCSSNEECGDGDTCTMDVCVLGCCQHERTRRCITESEGFKSDTAVLQYVARNLTDTPSWTDISSDATLSHVSNVDDHPPETVRLPFVVPFFDQAVNAIALNPNGAVNLGQEFSCVGPVFGTCASNQLYHVVALYWADFNPAAVSAAQVFHKEREMVGINGVLEPTYSVQYQSIPLYSRSPTSDDPTFTFALDIHSSGRLVMRYHTIPANADSLLPTVSTARTFVRSRENLVPPASALEYEFPQIHSGSTITLCPIPKVTCVAPACGVLSGGTAVTVTGALFDVECLSLGQPSSHGFYCHFGASSTPATVISNTELRCVTPAAESVGMVLFQLSWGDGTTEHSQLLNVNGVLSTDGEVSVLDPTFHYTASERTCGCSVGHNSTLSCDACGICGGSSECFGCDNVLLSTTSLDLCGVCGGNGSSCAGCDGVPLSGEVIDFCGVCGGNNATLDCYDETCVGTARFDDCGICSGGESGLVPNADQDCAGVCYGLSVEDECRTCDANSTNDCTQDCAMVWGGSAFLDTCGICTGGTTGVAAGSTLDCMDVCSGTAAFDDCTVCSGGTSGHTANSDKDSCGVCSLVIGTDLTTGAPSYDHVLNSDQDCHGVCFGGDVVDYCGVCGGLNATLDCNEICDGPEMPDACGQCDITNPADPCELDCNGDWNIRSEGAAIDFCGNCSGGQTGTVPNYARDCEGVCFGAALFDECGVCDADNSNDCPQDCHGVWGGAAALDACEVCAGGTTGLEPDADLDCAGVCGGPAHMDNCEVCDSRSWNDCLQDCQNVWGGFAYFDLCAVCSGGTTNHTANGDRDCSGRCFGNATLDSCGVCSGGSTNVEPDSLLDCAGVCFGDAGYDAKRDRDCDNACFGNATLDSCAVCSGGTTGNTPNGDVDCAGMCFGPHVQDECGDCVNTNTEQPCRRDCTGIWGGEAVLDGCARCTGASTGRIYDADRDCAGHCFGSAFRDSCGICSGAGTGHAPDSDRDRCGSCAPLGSGLKPNRDEDCAGICFGSAEIDDCGVCTGSHAKTL
eukprot:SAG31_NODE_2269_length_6047_cov_3.503699_2_plen_1301_part_00